MQTIIKTGLGMACMLSTAAAHHEELQLISRNGGLVFYGWSAVVLVIAVALTVGSRRYGRVQR